MAARIYRPQTEGQEALSYRLEGFEGPLELLLHLIARHKLNIFDIEISVLLAQYLRQMEEMQRQNLDLSSEFLEMAARLVYIKTVSLLPKPEPAQELQQELQRELVDYQQYRLAAQVLGAQFGWDSLTRPPEALPAESGYRCKHTPKDLLAAYQSAVGRGRRFLPPSVERFSAVTPRKLASVSAQAVAVLRLLRRRRQVEYAALFVGKQGKSQQIATFLAVLELIRNGKICVQEEGSTSLVRLTGRQEE